ncbi:MAG: tRNA (adenosine(37)-N6)-threonylcarbamoyltransferase complex dimerization subunit type 1 TsaB [Patescibacteria group bacterium]
MYTLAFDTTNRKVYLAILKKDEILFEREWKSNANESETLIKTIKSFTDETPMFFQQLKKIMVVVGPGGFNGTRAGVVVANMLMWLTGAGVSSYKTFDWWKKRLTKDDQKRSPHLILKATEQEIYVDGKPVEFEKFAKEIKKRKGTYVAYGEITPTQQFAFKELVHFQWIDAGQLLSFGKVMKEVIKGKISGGGKKSPVSVLYIRPPHITAPKKKTQYV